MIGWKRLGIAVMKFVLGLYNTLAQALDEESVKKEKKTRREK